MVAATLSPGESTAEMALGIAGLVTALLVIASPIHGIGVHEHRDAACARNGKELQYFWRTHQVGVTNPYSYLAVVLNAAMWVEFGIPAMVKLVHGHHHALTDWLGVPLMAANGLGVIVELCYVAVFIRFAAGNRGLPLICLFAISVVSGVVLALLLSTGWSRTFVGWFAMFSGVAMYVMPLHATFHAYRNNDVNRISHWQASASFANGVVWTAYACIGRVHAFVFVPNVAAILCAGTQLLVWVTLKRRAARQAAAAREQAEADRRATEQTATTQAEDERRAPAQAEHESRAEEQTAAPAAQAEAARGAAEQAQDEDGAASKDLESLACSSMVGAGLGVRVQEPKSGAGGGMPEAGRVVAEEDLELGASGVREVEMAVQVTAATGGGAVQAADEHEVLAVEGGGGSNSDVENQLQDGDGGGGHTTALGNVS